MPSQQTAQTQVWQKSWEVLCVDLFGPYTLKGNAKTEIDFMCLTMIDTATCWIKIVELPVVDKQPFPQVHGGMRASQHIIQQRYLILINPLH